MPKETYEKVSLLKGRGLLMARPYLIRCQKSPLKEIYYSLYSEALHPNGFV